jgi:hypothetical protein
MGNRKIVFPKIAPFITRVFKHERWQVVVGEMIELNLARVLRIPEGDFIMQPNASEKCIASYNLTLRYQRINMNYFAIH